MEPDFKQLALLQDSQKQSLEASDVHKIGLMVYIPYEALDVSPWRELHHGAVVKLHSFTNVSPWSPALPSAASRRGALRYRRRRLAVEPCVTKSGLSPELQESSPGVGARTPERLLPTLLPPPQLSQQGTCGRLAVQAVAAAAWQSPGIISIPQLWPDIWWRDGKWCI
ncbi:hypothetical protein P7K49_024516 [Saguinus oedipus]|uniref:Uncharacterized protein n=1 Tax=Saguinus oedipus TaxID=9490 RepID=A0ABQ9UPQ4_SAGOE|nr:hypothetical protein P7K49_024516 [Saguinus oedipus]